MHVIGGRKPEDNIHEAEDKSEPQSNQEKDHAHHDRAICIKQKTHLLLTFQNE